jgi:hypothetical protein
MASAYLDARTGNSDVVPGARNSALTPGARNSVQGVGSSDHVTCVGALNLHYANFSVWCISHSLLAPGLITGHCHLRLY